jgi:outer membrane protein OmpA-like peptidoglycan-associated protein/tetratricopeptide (TPR) repeat protein
MEHFSSNPQNTWCSMTRLVRVLTFFIFLLSGIAHAQPRYTSVNKSAIKNYEAGLEYYDKYQSEKAREEFLKAVEKDPMFIEPYLVLVNIYVEAKDYDSAIKQYKRVVDINPNYFSNSYYNMANIELNIGRYEDARSNYEKFLKLPSAKEPFISNAKRKITSCDFAINALKNPVPFNPQNLGAGVNSEFDEYFPTITIDDQTMFFTRNRPESVGSKKFHEDFYISRRKDNSWGDAVNAGMQLNTPGNEGVPNISSDGKLLFFAACHRMDGKGSCDIYYSRYRPEGWTRPLNLGHPVNTGAWESQPSFASDGRTLYFIRGTITGKGIREQDIYFSVIGDDGRWSEPKKLPDHINTPEEEEFVFIHPDNQTLYFSSDGHPGMGGLDIYVVRRKPDSSWGQPENLGYPINTWNDERGLLVGPKGDIAYIASDREGGLGGLDLYSFELYESARPLLTSYVMGVVTDQVTGKRLEASFEIIDLESGRPVISSQTEKGTGEFLASLTAGKDYALNVSKSGYLFYSDHFSCKNPADIKNAYVLEVALNPAKEGGKVVLKNVFFDTNKFDLKPESFPELEKLVTFMKSNPGISIEVSGHTDSTGDKKKNQALSENRARAVFDYLTSKGISSGRIAYAGYGDSRPVASNDTEEGRALNRRTEFLITGTK